jgi:hypothetical protein
MSEVVRPRPTKIFGIGLPRTGTVSLTAATSALEFKSIHYVSEVEYERALELFACLTDLPIPSRYRDLDRRFPGAKFILTTRDFDSWLDSNRRWFSSRPLSPARGHYRTELFGTLNYSDEAWTETYQRHHREVDAYFEGRESDLLRMNIVGGEGWEVLAPFLGVPLPGVPFPHMNRFGSRQRPPPEAG